MYSSNANIYAIFQAFVNCIYFLFDLCASVWHRGSSSSSGAPDIELGHETNSAVSLEQQEIHRHTPIPSLHLPEGGSASFSTRNHGICGASVIEETYISQSSSILTCSQTGINNNENRNASGHRKRVACKGPPIFSSRRPIGTILLLKENSSVREVGSEIQNSSIVSDRAEILEEFDSEAEMSDHAPPRKHNNDDAPNTTPPSPVSKAKRQSTASLDNGRLQSPRLSERRGKGKLRLFVVNDGGKSSPSEDSRFFQDKLLLKLSPGSTQGSACSTPLPQYTQCIEDPPLARTASTNRRTSFWDIKQRLVLSYVSEQQARLLHHPPSTQEKESPSRHVSEPPPYLSDREPNRRADEELNCSSATVQTQARQAPPLANAQRLRPLILPTQFAKRDATVPVEHSKQRPLRPLLLPQDVEERNRHEVSARLTFKPTTVIPASISACGVGELGGLNQIEEVLRLLDKNGLSHSTPKLVQSAMLRQDVLQSFESLASTYGTTPDDSLANISSQARDTLLLPPMPESGSDWEVQIIGGYCILSGVYL